MDGTNVAGVTPEGRLRMFQGIRLLVHDAVRREGANTAMVFVPPRLAM